VSTVVSGSTAERGRISFARSFWLAFVLPWTLAHTLLDGATTWLTLHGAPLVLGSRLLFIAWPVAVGLLVWGAVRTWRAASAHAAAGHAPLWRWSALTAMTAALLFTAATLVLQVLPRAPEAWQHVQGRDALEPARLSSSSQGRAWRLQGALALGDGERIAALLHPHQAGKLLELQLDHGHRAEALRLADELAARGWRTRVVGNCGPSCVNVFLAGRDRQLMPEGRLTLHRRAPATLNPLWRAWSRQREARQWQQAGLPQHLVRKALSATPARPWHPEMDELVAAGLAGVPGRPLDVALPEGNAPASEWQDALRSNPVWLALERRLPGMLAAAVEPLPTARAAGLADTPLQILAQQTLQARLPELLREASTALREHYTGLQADRLAALGPASAETCRRMLAGDPGKLRELPVPLRLREAAWLLDVANDTPPADPARDLNTLELEVLARAVGPRAPSLLPALGPAERSGRFAIDCALAAQLLAEVSRLPVAERRLALRLMYGRS
jgi:hypothetical protein